MLEKPEQRVGDDVVVLVVTIGLRHHEAEAELRRGTEVDQALSLPTGDLRPDAVAIGHGRRNPDRLVLAGDRGDRSDDPPLPFRR
jgi:hypothetical protein